MSNVKIFLSSTFVDLSVTRKKISTWLSGVFGADLIIMETFGSDTAPPDVHSVRRVSECDIFVGIYAHRYGIVDPDSGKSITELELIEAEHAQSTGTVSDILLYLVQENSAWGEQYKENSELAKTGLKRLKSKAKKHTCSHFKSTDELLFSIVRDVYRKISDRFPSAAVRIRQPSLPAVKAIREPLGMDFLTSSDRYYLFGRQRNIAELTEQLAESPIVLLLGDSGVGKTSLIHAGLIPACDELKMRPIYARPLGLPCTDIAQKVQSTIFEGPATYKGSLLPLLAETSAALKNGGVLLIVDQFEDVLTAQNEYETTQLVEGLRAIHELEDSLLRVLISYRADLEGRLGQYWQQISGSPKGLTRHYLGGLNEEEAWSGMKRMATDLSLCLVLSDVEEKRIARDLLISSSAAGFSGVYPPYLQMLIEQVWSSTDKGREPYVMKNYQEAGGMEGVIGGYLNRLLQYAQDSQGHIRAVLISLVRSYGVKAQRTLAEIGSDTGLENSTCEGALEKLIDLRLVRHIDPYYEVSHDYIAKKIISDFADSEEREFKRFRELLTSKASAYQTTQSLLTHHEVLMLYKHKQRIIPTEQEARLILASWVNGAGPALYWLMNTDKLKLIEWLRAEESKKDLDQEQKVSIVLLRTRLGEAVLSERDYAAFRHYKLSAELSHLISETAPDSVPKELLLYGLRHRRGEVREACFKAIATEVKKGKLDWIRTLRSSSGLHCRDAYQRLVLEKDILPVGVGLQTDSVLVEFALLRDLVRSRSLDKVNDTFDMIKRRRPPKHIFHFAKGLKYVQEGQVAGLLACADRASAKTAEQLMAGIRGRLSDACFEALTVSYQKHNVEEIKRTDRFDYRKSKIYRTCTAIAKAVQFSTSRYHLPRLRATFSSITLTPSSRGLIYALLANGNSRDIKLILDRISAADTNIDIWNHTELGMLAAKCMQADTANFPAFLIRVLETKEFWEYIPEKDRPRHSKSELLSLKVSRSKGLYVRLAAYSAIGAAKMNDTKILLDLVQHQFGLIARAAAIRFIRLRGEDALHQLISLIQTSFQAGTAQSLANSIRYAEMDYFGLKMYE